MEDHLTIVAGLSPDQAVERAAALALEIAYWQQVLNDAEQINHGVHDAASAVLEVVGSALTLVSRVPPGDLDSIEAIIEQSRKAMVALQAIGNTIGSSLELAAGRQAALAPVAASLRRAAGLDPDSAGTDGPT